MRNWGLFKLLSLAAVFGYATVIFILSQAPGSNVGGMETGFGSLFGIVLPSYMFHVIEYILLGLLVANFIFIHIYTMRPLLTSLAITLVYGILDEIHQFFVPTRVCALEDIVANMVGGLLGIALFLSLVLLVGKVLNKL